MGFLGSIFNDAIDIAFTPARLSAAVLDELTDDDSATGFVKGIQEKTHIDE